MSALDFAHNRSGVLLLWFPYKYLNAHLFIHSSMGVLCHVKIYSSESEMIASDCGCVLSGGGGECGQTISPFGKQYKLPYANFRHREIITLSAAHKSVTLAHRRQFVSGRSIFNQ